MKKKVLVSVFALALAAALLLPFVKADNPSACFPEGHAKVLELGQCIQTENGYKLVLSDISGFPNNTNNTLRFPNNTNNTLQLQAVFKLFDSSGNLTETITLSPCTTQFCGAYYTTQHGLSIDLINAFAGIGQTAYADVYVRSWTQYKEFMSLGDVASFPGLRIELADISGYPTNAAFPQVTFKAYDSKGNLLRQFVLRRGWASQAQVIENVTNGVLTHLFVAFAGIGQTAYANVGFKTVNATPTPIPTATTLPCSNDVYASCPDGYSYVKSKCANGVLTEVQYFADPCLNHSAPTTKPPERETFTLNLKKGWNMVSTPVIGTGLCKKGKVCPAVITDGADITSTTCLPAKLWHYANSKYNFYGELAPDVYTAAGGAVFGPGGFWVKAVQDCKIELSASQKNFKPMNLQPGWNQIGAFYETTAFSVVKADCVVLSGPWHYNALTKKYEKVSILEPGEGYFVKVASACTLGESLPPMPE